MPERKLPQADVLRRLYWDEGLSPAEIAERYGASKHSVHGRMRRDGIPLRTKSEGSKLAVAKGVWYRRPNHQPLKDRIRCSACGWAWIRTEDKGRVQCPLCGKLTEQRLRPFRAKDAEKIKAYRREKPLIGGGRRLRKTVLLLVGRGTVACVYCGCDRPELLEINHKNGGGRKETGGPGNASRFYWSIAKLERTVDDLELTCRVCNSLHYLEAKYGQLPFRVVWNGTHDMEPS